MITSAIVLNVPVRSPAAANTAASSDVARRDRNGRLAPPVPIAITSILSSLQAAAAANAAQGLSGVVVETANKLQGLEFEVVFV